MQNRILIVEDRENERGDLLRHFTSIGWHADAAENGQIALQYLSEGREYDLVLLDLIMPKMDGVTLLNEIAQRQIRLPLTIVLSAYLDHFKGLQCLALGAKSLCSKPTRPEVLVTILDTLRSGNFTTLRKYFASGKEGLMAFYDENEYSFVVHPNLEVATFDVISERASKREKALKSYFQDATSKQYTISAREPLLVVGRRWNSWYPSFFDVPGGAYAIVGPNDKQGKNHVALIDPGFRFLKIFSDLGISVRDISTCVITHNHPDHIGGIFEYMASRHALGQRSRLFCNKATSDMLGNLANFDLEVKSLTAGQQADLLSYTIAPHIDFRVTVESFRTAHEEIGRDNSSIGLQISYYKGTSRTPVRTMVILGDTEYKRDLHRNEYTSRLRGDNNVGVAVLHIGSSQLKTRTGGHLYLDGLKLLLRNLDSELATRRYPGKMLILISEWGLEHATKQQICEICGTSIHMFGTDSPILDTIRALDQDSLQHVHLIPADIGLCVGIETGNIYLNEDTSLPPDQVDCVIEGPGLTYRSRQLEG
jgi:CheY-like chemotaxis protein